MLGYATFYTSLPVFSIVYDEDCPLNTVIKFPSLYKVLQKGRALNTKTFLIMCFKSVFQGAVIMISAVVYFENDFVNIVSITFTALIFAEILNVYLEVSKIHMVMIVCFILTILVYLGSMLYFENYLNVVYIFTLDILAKIAFITIVSWAPFAVFGHVYRMYYPETYSKI